MRLFFLEGEYAGASQRRGFALLAKPLLFLLPLLFLCSCTAIPPSLKTKPPAASLARRIAKLAAGSGARMGIVALHVESGRRLELNAEEEFEAASVIKLALLTEAAALEHEGRFDLTDRWRLTAKNVAAGSGMLDDFDPGLTPTNRDLLQLMIAISDNTAADRFIDLFGAEAVNARMAALGLPGVRLVGRIPNRGQEPPKWPPLGILTPRDTAEFYRRVATRSLLDPASDRLLASLLAKQRSHDRLPRLLLDAPGTSWAGKSGSYGGIRNDSGILTTKKGRFVLVALVDRFPDTPDGRARAIRAMGDIASAIVNEWSSSLPDLEPLVEPPLRPVLMPPVPRAERTLAEARANPDSLHLDRVYRDTDRRFWDLWRAAGGDIADACLIPMPNSWWEGYEPFKIEPISALVLHHTSQDTDEECIALFQKPESKVSSHFLVGRDGRLFQFVSLEHRAWHAGVSLLHGRMALNRTSVGVEITGDGNRYPFTPAEVETVVRLVGVLTAMFQIDAPWIAGHQHIAPDRKNDPGALFPWNEVVRRGLALAQKLNGHPVPSSP